MKTKSTIPVISPYLGWGIAIISMLAYLPGIYGKFVWDDELYLTANPQMGKLDAAHLKLILTEIIAGNWHPLTMLSLAIDFLFNGLTSTTGYHITNLVLHGANTVILYFILLKFFKHWLPIVFITLCFGIHPLHVESVTWISERKDVLYVFFYFLAWFAGLNFKGNQGKIIVTLFFALSCLSKAVAVTFPLTLLLSYYLLTPNDILAKIKKELPWFILWFVMALGTGIMAISAQGESVRDYKIYQLSDNFFVGMYALLFYPFKLIAPFNLSAYYPYPSKINTLPPLLFLIAPVIVGIIIFLFWKLKSKFPQIIPGALFYLIGILPLAQFLPVGNCVAADRYSYLASVGIAWMLWGFMGNYLLENIKEKLLWIIPFAYLALYFPPTWIRTNVWKDTVTLWTDVKDKYPEVAMAHYNLGNYYMDGGNNAKALEYFKTACNINPKQNLHPNYEHAWNNLGNVYFQEKQYSQALSAYLYLINYDSTYPGVYVNLGNLYRDIKKPDSALFYLNKAIFLQPNHPGILQNMGMVMIDLGNLSAADSIYQSLLKTHPDPGMVMQQLGVIQGMKGNPQGALDWYAKVLQIQPNNHLTRINAAVTLNQMGRSDSAIYLLQVAARSGFPQAQEMLKANGLKW